MNADRFSIAKDVVHWVAAPVLLLLCGIASAQCPVDTIHRAGFDAEGSGLVIDGMLAGLTDATVELRSGSTVLASTSAGAGLFSLPVPLLQAGTMLELRARGLQSSNQTFVELASWVGSAAYLFDRSRQDGHLHVVDLPALALSPTNTSTYALVRLGQPAPPANECELATRVAALTQADLRKRAAVSKIVIADGGFASTFRRPGSTAGTAPVTTLDLLLDPNAFATESNAIELDAPGRIAGLEQVLGESFCDRFGNEAILVGRERALGNKLNILLGAVYQRSSPTTGSQVNNGGGDNYQWACSGDVMRVIFAGSRVAINYPIRLVDGVPLQVPSEIRTATATLTRIDSDPDLVMLASLETSRQSFPYNPTLPDEMFAVEESLALIRQRTGTPFETATVPGEYVLPSLGKADDNNGNRLRLDAGGGGLDRDDQQPLSWLVNAAGELVLGLTGRTARIIPLRDETASVRDVFAIVDFQSGKRVVSHEFALKQTPESIWTAPSAVAGSYVQNAGRVTGDSTYRLVFDAVGKVSTYNDDFSGPYAGQTFPGAVMYRSWISPGTLTMRRCRGTDGSGNPVERVLIDREPVAGECDRYYRQRTWIAYTSNGPDLYVYEINEDWYQDPTTAPTPRASFRRPKLYRFTPPVLLSAPAVATQPSPARASTPMAAH